MDGMRRTLAVDLDGTAAINNGKMGIQIGKRAPGALTTLRAFRKAGWQILIHTVRPDEWVVKYWCDKNLPGIVDGINCNPEDVATTGIETPKPYADVYLDDKAWPIVGQPFKWAAFRKSAKTRGWI